MCVTICGRFCPDEGVVAGYDNRIRVKYTAKWGVQIARQNLAIASSLYQILESLHNPEMNSRLCCFFLILIWILHKTELGINGSPPGEKLRALLFISYHWEN